MIYIYNIVLQLYNPHIKKMNAIYKKCMGLYPQLLFIAIIALCHVRQISYAYAIGYIVNDCVNYGLKTGFRSVMGDAGNRPMPYYPVQPHSLGGRADAYGFPSGHAQSVGYFLAFAHQFLPWRAWHPGWIVAAVLVAAWLLHARVAFRRHTGIQVLAGFGFGVLVFRLLHSWVRS